jgi:hypothetical protein
MLRGGDKLTEKSSKIVSLGEPDPPSVSISYQDQFFVFFIQEIIVSYEGEVCGEEGSFPIAHAGAETPVP